MIISTVSFKGGVGKTTTAMHLAELLSRQGNTVLVDGDRTRSATTWASERPLGFVVTSPTGLGRHAKNAQHIVLDTRGGLSEEELRDAAEGSDLILLTSDPEFLSLDAMVQTGEALDRLGFPKSRCPVLLTKVSRRSKEEQEARELLGALGFRVLQQGVRFSKAFRDATRDHVLVGGVKGNRLAKTCMLDYEQVLAELQQEVLA